MDDLSAIADTEPRVRLRSAVLLRPIDSPPDRKNLEIRESTMPVHDASEIGLHRRRGDAERGVAPRRQPAAGPGRP